MKIKIVFKDSFDDSELKIGIGNESKKIIRIDTGDSSIWFSLADFEEFIQECTRFAVQLKESKKK